MSCRTPCLLLMALKYLLFDNSQGGLRLGLSCGDVMVKVAQWNICMFVCLASFCSSRIEMYLPPFFSSAALDTCYQYAFKCQTKSTGLTYLDRNRRSTLGWRSCIDYHRTSRNRFSTGKNFPPIIQNNCHWHWIRFHDEKIISCGAKCFWYSQNGLRLTTSRIIRQNGIQQQT